LVIAVLQHRSTHNRKDKKMSTYKQGAHDASQNKGPANTSGMTWQERNNYNAGYNSQK